MNFSKKNRLFFVVMAGMMVFASLLFILSSGVVFAQSLEQEGFRFREDDGNESGATWLASQDTNILRDKNLNTRLRVLLNATGDPASTQYQLEFKKATSSNYEKVLTAVPAMPTFQALGTAQSGIGAVTPAWPTHQAGDVALLFVESCGGEAVSLSTPAGFVQVANSPQATGTTTNGTRLTVFWCRATSSSMSSPTVADPGDHVYAVILTFRGCITVGNPWDVTAGGVKATASTTTTFGAATTTVPNCLIVLAASRDNDSSLAAWSAWTNASLSSLAECQDGGTTWGNGGGIGVATGGKAAAGDTGASTATVTSSVDGHMTIALKPPSSEILLSLSTQFADGDNTTAQLNAPSGKTTSNFTAGKIQEITNPAAAVDIANNYYTELEWCLIATAAAQYGDVYEFRVTAAGTVLNTYSVTPQWTIYEGRFEYRKQITIDKSKVSPCSSNPSNFPILISASGNWLKTKAADSVNGRIYSSSGYDIVFRADDGVTQLDHEIERYDGTNGVLVAWVRIPSLNYSGQSQNTSIYMYYGNGLITSQTANPTGVWESNYKGVWHLHDNFEDSTSNNHDGTNNNTTNYAGANIADGDDFNGTNGYIQTNSNELQTENNFTISLWFNADATNFARHLIWEGLGTANGFGDGAASTHQEMHLSFGRITGGVSEANYLTFFLGDTDDFYGDIIQASYAFSDITNWHHASVVVTGLGSSPRAELFLDGSSVASDTGLVARTSRTSWNTNLRFGRPGTAERYFDGGLDEVRICTTARDACWIQTEYNNQSSPGIFITLGSEESPAPTAVKLTSFTATEYSDGVLLKWHTGYEVDNLGFHVYREENGQLVRLTPEPVGGSALLAGSRTALIAGHRYFWWDFPTLDTRPSSLATLKYWLEDIDLSGKRTMHGPVTPVFSREPLPEKFRPELLSELGMRLEERYRHYWKVQELKERLGKRPSPIRHQQSAKSASSGETRRAAAQSSVLSTDQFRLSPQSRYESIPTSSLDTAAQQSLASRPAVKLLVKEEGWYRVTQPELVVAGLSSKINPEYLQLFMEGQEQPIRVIAGKDGRFGPGDAIEFYGVGLDTPSTDKRVYWLIEGSRPGKRVEVSHSHSQGGQISPSSFLSTVECKDRVMYFSALRNGEEENFFGSVVSPSGADQFLTLRHLDPAPSGEALLEVILQGATEGTHRVGVLLNEVEVGEVVFEGFLKELFQVGVPQALLEEGENLVSLIARGGEMDYSLLDLIRLSYWHTYEADGDELKFGGRGGEHLSISGFTHPTVQVVDITDPNDLVEVFGKVRAQGGAYLVEFEVPGGGEKRLLACTADRIKSPSDTVPNRPSSWSQSSLGYDFVMISHRDFIEALKPLKQLRESQGLSVALIDIEDIYDEFSFGAKSPKAIKDFLTDAKARWRKSPRYVLLVGDASSDPRNYLGYGDFDLVPTKLVETAYLETASDDWFVDFNNDGLPEIAIGRLPIQTSEEASIVVSKIVGYEKSSKKNEALLVADRLDQEGEFNFEGASEEVRSLLPSSLMVRKIYRGQFSSDTQARGVLLSSINEGPLLVNFIGHGSLEIWRGILTADDVETLVNGMKLPFFVNMTCLNGFFQNPYSETLAEALMKAKGGGAIAIWTSSGLTEPDKQAVMNKELIRLLFGRESLTLGEATAKAKKVISDQDVRKTWILFGDPSTRLKP